MHSHSHALTAPETRGRLIRWARWYDSLVWLWTLGRARSIRAETAALARIRAGAQVLDIGCGTGELTFAAERLAGSEGKVYGVDASPEMIEVAQAKATRQRSRIMFRTGVIEALDFPDATFDVVLSSLMWHHLPGDLKHTGLRELWRVLKPGGTLLIVDFQATSGLERFLSLHGHMPDQSFLQEVPEELTALGCTQIEQGRQNLRVLAYVRAVKPA